MQLKSQLEDAHIASKASQALAFAAQEEATSAAANLERHRAQFLTELQGWQAKYDQLKQVRTPNPAFAKQFVWAV